MSNNNIKVYFVLPTNSQSLCRENLIISTLARESACLRSVFTKKEVLVFDKFEGEIFKELQSLNSIVGPRCITTCLLEDLPILKNKSPVFSLAMNKLTVTTSNFSAEQKKHIKEKIEMMGGTFSFHMTQSVTHLVTNSVKTQKYKIANERNLKVMLDTWVEAVWTASLTRNVKADDQEFTEHKCPVFKNLRVCSTGFNAQERANLQRLITDNGGLYSGKLIVNEADTLICNPEIQSEKFSVALRYKIPCLTVNWIHDSLEKGFAMPIANYGVTMICSTPANDSAPHRGNQSIPPEIPVTRIEPRRIETGSVQKEPINPILEGKTFKLVGYSDQQKEIVRAIVEELRGNVVRHSYNGMTDYAVAPTICSQVRHNAMEIVNDLWVHDCHNKNRLLDVQYYHEPFFMTHDVKPLKNCVITLSGFTSFERTYLMLLLEHLGALYQDKYSVQCCTHLVCLEPSGSEYMDAVRLNRPVVSFHWILQCAIHAELLDEMYFLLEKATDASTEAEDLSDSTVLLTPQPPSPIITSEQSPQTSTAANNETETMDKLKPVEDNTVTAARTTSSFKEFANEAVPVVAMKERLELADPLMTLEDGTKILLSKFMQDLRDQGLFDTPSPLPVFSRPSREDVLPMGSKDGTPKRNLMAEFSEAEAGCSQDTPVGRYIRDLKERNVLPSTPTQLSTPDSPLPRPYFDVDTPDTPLGQFLEENPSRETRKYFQMAINRFKDYEPPRPRLPSTPWSEVKRQAWAWLLRDKSAEQQNPVVKTLSDEMEDNAAEKEHVEDTGAASTAAVSSPVIDTPDTPLGQFLEENPSRETREHFQIVTNRFKDYEPPRPRLPSTPWSEVKRQAWAWLLRDKSAEQQNPVVKTLSDEMEDNAAEKEHVEDTGAAYAAAVSSPVIEVDALEELQQTPLQEKIE